MNSEQRYRYRTGVLVGPWRECPKQALGDAVDAGQVRRNDQGGHDWIVPGEIEEVAARRKRRGR